MPGPRAATAVTGVICAPWATGVTSAPCAPAASGPATSPAPVRR
ncbi:hypothetical protein [Streptomyces sp. SMS_SU21]|nr:hypothetical protein [Streptomyces sp. SMS_SU21]